MILKAPKAPQGRNTVEPGDGIQPGFLRVGQHPFCRQMAPTIKADGGDRQWVVVEVRE